MTLPSSSGTALTQQTPELTLGGTSRICGGKEVGKVHEPRLASLKQPKSRLGFGLGSAKCPPLLNIYAACVATVVCLTMSN